MKTGHLTLLLAAFFASACGPREGEHTLTILTTDDVHGAWFDSTYVGEGTKPSLFAVKYVIDSVRNADGPENVLLLDAGDCLQGDNATYYYNFVDTLSPHPFPRLMAYMGYDAVVVGNHDIEAGHKVYDRVARDLGAEGIPFLAGNVVREDDGSLYFPLYKVFKRAGLKVLVLGYTNPNMRAWLSSEALAGQRFLDLLPLVQHDVDSLRAIVKPHVVVVATHSGMGDGDGSSLESQGLDLYRSLRGVDFVICSHDHRQAVMCNDSIALLNGGSRARYVTDGKLTVTVKKGKVAGKSFGVSLLRVDKDRTDPGMKAAFRKEYETVRAFTNRKIGTLEKDIRTREAFTGMSDYTNLVHLVQLEGSGADISIAAPLTYNGTIHAGDLVFNDLFTIYPYENQLFTLSMSGREIKGFLEYSYDLWLADPGTGHVLGIVPRNDDRYQQAGWSFDERSYNFDSAAGINYTVDVSKPMGRRISISGMADGSAFDEGKDYVVAMTSYRASGGGDTIIEGAGIAHDEIDSRIVGRYKEIRDMVYDYIAGHPDIDSEMLFDKAALGEWNFIPEKKAREGIEKDMELLFGRR